jgi:hypothetical protein
MYDLTAVKQRHKCNRLEEKNYYKKSRKYLVDGVYFIGVSKVIEFLKVDIYSA